LDYEDVKGYLYLMIETVTIHAYRMTDEEFEQFCFDNPDLRIERTAEKEIIVMSPSFPKTGIIINLINIKIGEWCLKTKSGYIADSSSGFYLPDGSMFSPDVAWIPMTQWKKFSAQDKNSFLKYCPEFIVEVKSTSDRISALKNKMSLWIKNGSKLGWLIDPDEERVWIYEAQKEVQEISGFDNTLSGGEILKDFSFDLKDLRLD
jgi:Uma2 family endonuclease